jgi:glycosyltransferase involved in cell wall biosynthesis
MKIALVHDYIRDFGGAERVLKALTEIYPASPIYTAFAVKDSTAYREFQNKKIIESSWAPFIRKANLYSPLRFLLPWIWKSIDLSDYDLVITSCSNYLARGFKVGKKTKVIAYCHTPPRWLYGYATGDLQKILPIRIYAALIAHFIRIFDFNSAQEVDAWIVNSQNVAARVQKFYRRESKVIYPPVDTKKFSAVSQNIKKENWFLIVSRLVGTKGIVEAAQAAKKLGIQLKIVGEGVGLLSIEQRLKKSVGKNVELLGRVEDEELMALYARAKGFIALARDEDFGLTVVEAQAAGTPVIAFAGGGFLESVVEGKTGIFVKDTDVATLGKAFKRFNQMKWDKREIQKNAEKFSKERFIREIKNFILKNVKT